MLVDLSLRRVLHGSNGWQQQCANSWALLPTFLEHERNKGFPRLLRRRHFVSFSATDPKDKNDSGNLSTDHDVPIYVSPEGERLQICAGQNEAHLNGKVEFEDATDVLNDERGGRWREQNARSVSTVTFGDLKKLAQNYQQDMRAASKLTKTQSKYGQTTDSRHLVVARPMHLLKTTSFTDAMNVFRFGDAESLDPASVLAGWHQHNRNRISLHHGLEPLLVIDAFDCLMLYVAMMSFRNNPRFTKKIRISTAATLRRYYLLYSRTSEAGRAFFRLFKHSTCITSTSVNAIIDAIGRISAHSQQLIASRLLWQIALDRQTAQVSLRERKFSNAVAQDTALSSFQNPRSTVKEASEAVNRLSNQPNCIDGTRNSEDQMPAPALISPGGLSREMYSLVRNGRMKREVLLRYLRKLPPLKARVVVQQLSALCRAIIDEEKSRLGSQHQDKLSNGKAWQQPGQLSRLSFNLKVIEHSATEFEASDNDYVLPKRLEHIVQGGTMKCSRVHQSSKALRDDEKVIVATRCIRILEGCLRTATRVGTHRRMVLFKQRIYEFRRWLKSILKSCNLDRQVLQPTRPTNRFTGKTYSTLNEEIQAVQDWQAQQKIKVKNAQKRLNIETHTGKERATCVLQLETDVLKLKVATSHLAELQAEEEPELHGTERLEPTPTEHRLPQSPLFVPYDILHYLLEDVLYQFKRAMFMFGRRSFPEIMQIRAWSSPESVPITEFQDVMVSDPNIRERYDFCRTEFETLSFLRNIYAHESWDIDVKQTKTLLGDLIIVAQALSFGHPLVPHLKHYQVLLTEFETSASGVRQAWRRRGIAKLAAIEARFNQSRDSVEGVRVEEDNGAETQKPTTSESLEEQVVLFQNNWKGTDSSKTRDCAKDLQAATFEKRLRGMLDTLPSAVAMRVIDNLQVSFAKEYTTVATEDQEQMSSIKHDIENEDMSDSIQQAADGGDSRYSFSSSDLQTPEVADGTALPKSKVEMNEEDQLEQESGGANNYSAMLSDVVQARRVRSDGASKEPSSHDLDMWEVSSSGDPDPGFDFLRGEDASGSDLDIRYDSGSNLYTENGKSRLASDDALHQGSDDIIRQANGGPVTSKTDMIANRLMHTIETTKLGSTRGRISHPLEAEKRRESRRARGRKSVSSGFRKHTKA